MTTITRALTAITATAITATTLVACSTDSTTEAPASETARTSITTGARVTDEATGTEGQEVTRVDPTADMDDVDTVDVDTDLRYMGSGAYALRFGEASELKERRDAFNERWACSDRTITIERYGVPTEPDGFLAGWVYGDNVSRANVHKQATLATTRFAAYPVTDGTATLDELSSQRKRQDVPRVTHDPDSSTSTECFGPLPEDADQIYIKPNFDDARVMAYQATKDDRDVDGWLIDLPKWDH